MNILAFIVEFIGSFVFLAVIMLSHGNPWLIGLALALLIYFAGIPTSAGHFNPIVTIATVLNNNMTSYNAIGYIIAQIFGAILAVAVVRT